MPRTASKMSVFGVFLFQSTEIRSIYPYLVWVRKRRTRKLGIRTIFTQCWPQFFLLVFIRFCNMNFLWTQEVHKLCLKHNIFRRYRLSAVETFRTIPFGYYDRFNDWKCSILTCYKNQMVQFLISQWFSRKSDNTLEPLITFSIL